MDERDFEILDVLNQTKNITHAADLLYVTQSALSKRISTMEDELGIKIMIRSRKGIHFTPDGEVVLKHSRKVSNHLKEMRESINLNKEYITGSLKVGVSINYSQYDFPNILENFCKKYPQVNLTIETNYSRKLYQKLLAGIIDVAIIRGEFDWKEEKIRIKSEPICIIKHNKFLGKSLKEIDYINRHTDLTFEREISRWIQENNLHASLKYHLTVNNISTCVEMVSRGLGWAIVPEICLKDFNGLIEPIVFKNGEPFVRSTYLLYNKEAFQLPQVAAFVKTAQSLTD